MLVVYPAEETVIERKVRRKKKPSVPTIDRPNYRNLEYSLGGRPALHLRRYRMIIVPDFEQMDRTRQQAGPQWHQRLYNGYLISIYTPATIWKLTALLAVTATLHSRRCLD